MALPCVSSSRCWNISVKDASDWRKAYEEMKTSVEEHGWDGEWYPIISTMMAPVGSHKNQYGQIYLNGQSWAVFSGFASSERAGRPWSQFMKS